MSKTIESLHKKIDVAADLQTVVRTMKAMAASNIGQYEKSQHALNDYYRTVELGLGACFRERKLSTTVSQPLVKEDFSNVAAIIFGSDQGLVGQFNDAIVEYALERIDKIPGEHYVWCVGERVKARLIDLDLQLEGIFQLPNSINVMTRLVGKILLEIGEFDNLQLYLFYNHRTSGAIYEPVCEKILPLDKNWQDELIKKPWPTDRLPEVLGKSSSTLSVLIREYLFVSLFRACTESLTSENASRLKAMQRAEKNIEELLGNLKGDFHRLRQSSIDEELFDVISGFEALSKDNH